MNGKRNRILVVTFANDLPAHDLSLFRGAVISTVGQEHVLFHNHQGDKLRYSYPLVQYKRIGGKAALVCLGVPWRGCRRRGRVFRQQHVTVADW